MPPRYVTLAAWANQYDWRLGAELGVSDGKTHLYLLEHCPNLHLIGVDVWDMPGVKLGATTSNERCECPNCLDTKAGRRKTTMRQREEMARYSSERLGRSTLYKMRTVDAAAKVEDGSLDFVFVDGDHSMEGVRDDIAAWKAKIRPGGWMIGHDYNMASVRAGVSHHYPESDVLQEDDHIWFVKC